MFYGWKWFTEEEVEGLKPDLVYKLDRAREFYGKPIIITSGYRNPQRNKESGGVPGSLHTKGLAVDVRGPKNQGDREKLIWALTFAGLRQIQSYKKDGHLHLELDAREGPWFNFVEG